MTNILILSFFTSFSVFTCISFILSLITYTTRTLKCIHVVIKINFNDFIIGNPFQFDRKVPLSLQIICLRIYDSHKITYMMLPSYKILACYIFHVCTHMVKEILFLILLIYDAMPLRKDPFSGVITFELHK